MKINWGHKLVFFMVVFMLFIVVLIYHISRQQVDLVDKNYYEKGITHISHHGSDHYYFLLFGK